MPRIIPFPEPAPYAGEVSINIDTHSLDEFAFPFADRTHLIFNAEGVPSNVAPHMIKRLGRLGVGVDETTLTTTALPHPELQIVTEIEVREAASDSGGGKRMWAALERAVEAKPECGLVLGDSEEPACIRGDFGFGLEWLNINYTMLTGRGIAHNILLRRSDRLSTASSGDI